MQHNEDGPPVLPESQNFGANQDPSRAKEIFAQLLPFLVLLIAFGTIVHLRGRNSADFPGWHYNNEGFKKAYETHQKSKQKVLVYFHTSWCGYCKVLNKELFSTKEFQTKFANVIKVSIDPDTSSHEEGIASQWGVVGYPTLYVVDDWARPPRAVEGFASRRPKTPDQLLQDVMR